MTLTAFLSPTLLSGLSDVSVSPGAGQNGYPLTWNNTSGKWVASLLAISSLTGGPLPTSQGGTGSNTGSITATGALALASGGSNQNLSLSPSGTGRVTTSRLTLSDTSAGTSSSTGALQVAGGIGTGGSVFVGGTLRVAGGQSLQMSAPSNQTEYAVFGLSGSEGSDSFLRMAFGLSQGQPFFGFGTGSAFRDVAFIRNGTNTVRIAGNVGGTVSAVIQMVGSLSVSGKVTLSGLPTSEVGLSPGDLWRDGATVKVKL